MRRVCVVAGCRGMGVNLTEGGGGCTGKVVGGASKVVGGV